MVYINDVSNSLLLLTSGANSKLDIELLRTTTDEDIWLKVNSVIVEVTRTDSADNILASLVNWIFVEENFGECSSMLEAVKWTILVLVLTDFMIEVSLTDFVDVSLIVLILLADSKFVKENFLEFISMLGLVNQLEATVVVTAIDWILEVILTDLMVDVSSVVVVILVLTSLTFVIVESVLTIMGNTVLAIALDGMIVSISVIARRDVGYGITLEYILNEESDVNTSR